MGVYVVRTSSLNEKHSCQLFRKASSLVLLSSSVSKANLSCDISVIHFDYALEQLWNERKRNFHLEMGNLKQAELQRLKTEERKAEDKTR